MANKFLEYLLTDKLKDLTYNLKEMNSERDKRYSSKIEEYPYIDDFFKFLFELNVSQEDIFNSIRVEKSHYSLAHMIFGYETQNDKNRKEKFNTFKPLIESNIDFYKQIMAVALSDHQYISENFKEMNSEIFSELVDIGIEKDFFNYLKETEKQTSIPQYKKILIEKCVFDTRYDIEKTIEYLYSKDEVKKINHFSMNSHDIHKVLENLDDDNYTKLLKNIEITITKLSKKPVTDNELKNYFNQFINNLIKVEKIDFLPLLNNKFIKESLISTDKYNNHAFSEIVIQPKLLEGLLVQCNEYELAQLFKKERYSSGSVIAKITEDANGKMYINESLLSMVLENIDKHILENEEENKNIVISHILFNQVTRIKDKSFVNKIFEKYTKNIVKALSASSESESYSKPSDRLLKFNESKKIVDSGVWNKISAKLAVAEKDLLYKFSQNFKIKGSGYENRYENKKYLEHLVSYINLTDDISVLNILNVDTKNPEWKNITFDFEIGKKSYNEENILIFLLRKISKEDTVINLVKWIIEESSENFYELKFGAKDILSYYQKADSATKNSTLLNKVVNIMLEKETSFESLLKNNKPKLKLINALALEDEEIKKKLSYYTLKQKLSSSSKSEPEVVKIKNKI